MPSSTPWKWLSAAQPDPACQRRAVLALALPWLMPLTSPAFGGDLRTSGQITPHGSRRSAPYNKPI